MTSVTKDSRTTKKKKSQLREWLESIVFAIVVASAVHWLIIQPYTIPTSSMESSLLTGDFLFVSKLHYGARTPRTLIQFPLTHQTFWGTGIPSFVDWIQMPQTRLPGFSSVKRNDVVVFNYPGNPGNPGDRYGGYNMYPIDLRTNYIKRCVGVAGDKIELRERQLYVNGELAQNPEHMQYLHEVFTTQALDERFFEKFEISEYRPTANGFVGFLSPQTAEKLKQLDFVKAVHPSLETEPNLQVLPYDTTLVKWNRDTFGPLYIPKKGDKITLDAKNMALYKYIILLFDHNNDVKEENGKIILDGQPITEYTFKQNYYWMMGDNRHNSEDSRYWGFVPEDHVVGKAVLVWLSINPNKTWGEIGSKVRWSRLFSSIK